ncbi:MAG: hypothetical protein AAFU03_06750, partial [Bacteroidota bacterium]
FFTISSQVYARDELLALLKSAVQEGGDPIERIKTILDEMPNTINFGDPGLKALKIAAGTLHKKINQGHETEDQTVYGFAYHDCGRMAYYDQFGLFIYDRPLKPNERQGSIVNIQNKVA